MAGPTDEILADLDAAERGFVLGMLVASPGGVPDPTTALEPPSDVRCAKALARIGALPRPERVRLTGELAREIVARPAGIDAIEATALADLLRDEPPEIVRLVTGAASSAPTEVAVPAAVIASDIPGQSTGQGERTRPSAPEASPGGHRSAGPAPGLIAELQAALCSELFPHLVEVPSPRGLLALEPAELLARLTSRGAAVLGLSLQGAGGDVVLRAATLVGPPWADQILAASRGPASPTEDAGEPDTDPTLDRTGAAQLVASTPPAADPRETVARIGARATGLRLVRTGARGLGGADRARALAQRLPAALGAELLAAAGLDPPCRKTEGQCW